MVAEVLMGMRLVCEECLPVEMLASSMAIVGQNVPRRVTVHVWLLLKQSVLLPY